LSMGGEIEVVATSPGGRDDGDPHPHPVRSRRPSLSSASAGRHPRAADGDGGGGGASSVGPGRVDGIPTREGSPRRCGSEPAEPESCPRSSSRRRRRRRSGSPVEKDPDRRGGRSSSVGSRHSLAPPTDAGDQAPVGSRRSKTSDRSLLGDGSGTIESAGTGRRPPRRGFLHHVKQLASKVKNTLGEMGGLNGVHKFRPGERARYKTVKIRDKNWMIAVGKYDVMTMTAEGKLLALVQRKWAFSN